MFRIIGLYSVTLSFLVTKPGQWPLDEKLWGIKGLITSWFIYCGADWWLTWLLSGYQARITAFISIKKKEGKMTITVQPNQDCISITGRWDTGILWALKQPWRGYGRLLAVGPCLWYWDFILQNQDTYFFTSFGFIFVRNLIFIK